MTATWWCGETEQLIQQPYLSLWVTASYSNAPLPNSSLYLHLLIDFDSLNKYDVRVT